MQKRTLQSKPCRVTVLCILLLAAGMLFACALPGNMAKLEFTEIEDVYSAAPKWFENSWNKSLTMQEMEELLGIDITACVPESLWEYVVHANAAYILQDQLFNITITLQEPVQETEFGGYMLISVANKAWSAHSTTSIDYRYSDTVPAFTTIEEVGVEAYVRPADAQPEARSPFSDPIYIAFFQVDGYQVDMEGGRGVTEEAFTELLVEIIRQISQ